MSEEKIQELVDDLWFEFADESDAFQTTMNYESFVKAVNKALSKELDNVKVWFFCSFHGSCIYKGVGRICSNKGYCQSKRAKT